MTNPADKVERWSIDKLIRMQAQQEAIEQLRGDLKDSMQLVRASTLAVND